MEEKVIKIVADVLNLAIEDITIDRNLTELTDWDSLSTIMVLAELQEQLNIKIPIDSPIECQSVRDLMTLIGV